MSHAFDQGAQMAVCPVAESYCPEESWALTDKVAVASIAAMSTNTVTNKTIRFKAPSFDNRTTNRFCYTWPPSYGS